MLLNETLDLDQFIEWLDLELRAPAADFYGVTLDHDLAEWLLEELRGNDGEHAAS